MRSLTSNCSPGRSCAWSGATSDVSATSPSSSRPVMAQRQMWHPLNKFIYQCRTPTQICSYRYTACQSGCVTCYGRFRSQLLLHLTCHAGVAQGFRDLGLQTCDMLPEHAGGHVGSMRDLGELSCAVSRQRESSRCPHGHAGWGESLRPTRRYIRRQSVHLHNDIQE